jgi:NTP pyrophosphatase (non-canonical NTP hydrolase)
MAEIKTATATFVAENQPDMQVRVAIDEFNGPAFSIAVGNTLSQVIEFDRGQELQGAEAAQFIADTLSENINGRLSPFVRGWISTAADIHHTALEKGWWDDGIENRNDGEMIALAHAELSEALEGLRKGNPPDSKVPEFSSVEVEFADLIIRVMDHAHARGWRIAQAIEAKMKYNLTRPHKHGKQF